MDSMSMSLSHRRRTVGGRPQADMDEGLDLFSRRRSTIPITSPGSNGLNEIRLGRISVGSGRVGKGGVDDLMDVDAGKHDYDWLLTPPGTPTVLPSSIANEPQPPRITPRSNITTRSVSTARASRLSTTQSDSAPPARPARSSSVSRSSVTSTYSNYFNTNNRTAALNTSSASVTSRPTTPSNRATSQSTTRPAPSISSVRARSATPAKTRITTSSTGDKIRPVTNSRPSTPTRPHSTSSSNSNSVSSVTRSVSRASTPTRRAPSPAPASVADRSHSVGRTPVPSVRNTGPSLRPSSPGPRPRAPVQPIHLPDFPLDVPPNLRTKLPDRPLSAGRTRPGMALTVKSNTNSETPTSTSSSRRQSSPVVSRNRYPENPPRARLHSNAHEITSPEIQKPIISESGTRRSSKSATATESTGFGRTISKKSIDMALKHMDIRQSMAGLRGASLFPQSIRSCPSKGRPARISDPVVPVTSDEFSPPNRKHNGITNGEDMPVKMSEREYLVKQENELDICGSTRYEAMLLKEDVKDMNWLHNVEDESEQSPVFDHRFEPLPEPFGLL